LETDFFRFSESGKDVGSDSWISLFARFTEFFNQIVNIPYFNVKNQSSPYLQFSLKLKELGYNLLSKVDKKDEKKKDFYMFIDK